MDRGPQVPGEREDPDRRRGWGRGREFEQARQAADTQHLGGQRGVTRRIDAGVAIAPDQAEERIDLAHPGPRQIAGQERPRERPDEPYDFSVVTELPGPERFFRRQSENEFFQRIREESKPGQGTTVTMRKWVR